MPLPWDEYIRRVQAFEGNPNSPSFYRPQWDVRQHSIGYGTRYRPGQDTSREGLERQFGDEFGQAASRVDAFAPDLSPGRRAALSSLTYNAGPKWMQAGLGEAVKRGDWEDARQRFTQYTSPDPRYRPGLERRRGIEAGWLADAGQPLPQAPMGAQVASARPALPPEWGQPMGLGASVSPTTGPIDFIRNLLAPSTQAAPSPAPGASPPDNIQVPISGDQRPPPPAPPPDFPSNATDTAGPPPPPPGISSGIVGAPPVQFPPIGDTTGLAPPPPPSPTAFGNFGMPPGAQPFPTQAPVPPDEQMRYPGAQPTAPTAPPPAPPPPPPNAGPVGGGGMAPAMAGGGAFGSYLPQGGQDFLGKAYNAFVNPLTGAGFQMMFPNSAAGGTLATAGMRAGAERRAESEEYRKQTEFSRTEGEAQRKVASWQKLFPGGGTEMNPDHPLAKGLPPQLGPVVQAMGPEQGIALLAKYQLMDAEKRADTERTLSLVDRLSGGAGGAAPAPTTAPAQAPAAPFTGAPSGPVGGTPFAPISSTGMYNAVGDLGPPPARAAPAAAAARAPAGEPMVSTPRGMMPLSEAERMASSWEIGKIPTGELRQSISRAAAPGQAAATKKAEMDVAQEQAKPQARLATTNVLDKLNATEALASKIHDDPRLWWTTGILSSQGPGGEARPLGNYRSDTRATMADIGTLVAKVGLDTLAAMREGSKTGASGLGGTSDAEINMLSNALTALKDTSISTEAYQQNLQIVKTVVANVRERMKGAWKETYGEDFKPSAELPQYPTKSVAQQKEEKRKARTPNDKMRQGGWSVEEIQ